MNIFNSLDYKEVLRKTFEDRKKALGDISYQAMAETCGVQKTYLSKVLNREGNLSSDQVYLACRYLRMNEEQAVYTNLIHSLELSQVKERKIALLREISHIQEKHSRTESQISTDQVIAIKEQLTEYHLDPLFSVIHMCLTLVEFGKNPLTLSKTLNISKEVLQNYLKKLEEMAIIQFENGKYKILRNNLHLSKDSPAYKPYKTLMKIKAIDQMDALKPDDYYSFSVVFSTSPRVRKWAQQKFMDFLKELQKEMAGEPESGVYQMNFDILNWYTKLSE